MTDELNELDEFYDLVFERKTLQEQIQDILGTQIGKPYDGSLLPILIPIIRRFIASTLAHDIISTQPMTSVTGKAALPERLQYD